MPSYVAAATSGLIYLPIKSGPQDQVLDWLAALDGVPREALRGKMSQKELRQWKRKMRGHRGFTVLRHPALRAHDAFCRHILTTGEGSYRQLRNTLMRRYKVPLPKDGPDDEYDREAHRAAFVAFLKFLKGNLAGQTSIRVDAAWCSQAQAIAGFGAFCLPDRILREEELASELPALAAGQGHATVPAVPQMVEPGPFTLGDIYDDEIEALTAEAYQKDYMTFGFSRWR